MMIQMMTMINLKILKILKISKIVKNSKLIKKLLNKSIMNKIAKRKPILNPNNKPRVKRQQKMNFD